MRICTQLIVCWLAFRKNAHKDTGPHIRLHHWWDQEYSFETHWPWHIPDRKCHDTCVWHFYKAVAGSRVSCSIMVVPCNEKWYPRCSSFMLVIHRSLVDSWIISGWSVINLHVHKKFVNLITWLQITIMIYTQAIGLSRVTYHGIIYSMLPRSRIIMVTAINTICLYFCYTLLDKR